MFIAFVADDGVSIVMVNVLNLWAKNCVLSEEHNLRNIFESLYIFLTTPGKVENYVKYIVII